MQSSTSLTSISSTSSAGSTSYGSQTILESRDLELAAPRCRSSIAILDDDNISFPPPLPPRRRSQLLSTKKTMTKCQHFLRTCVSSKSSPISLPTQTKLLNNQVRQEYFAQLCHNHRLLLVLEDYECHCGCKFSMKEGSFVILYESNNQLPTENKHGLVTVISDTLICSKVPTDYLCDVDLLRKRVRSRRNYHLDDQSFDL